MGEKPLYKEVVDKGKKLIAGITVGATVTAAALTGLGAPALAEDEEIEYYNREVEQYVQEHLPEEKVYRESFNAVSKAFYKGEIIDEEGEVDQEVVAVAYEELERIDDKYGEEAIEKGYESLSAAEEIVGEGLDRKEIDNFGDTIILNYTKGIPLEDTLKMRWMFNEHVPEYLEKFEEVLTEESYQAVKEEYEIKFHQIDVPTGQRVMPIQDFTVEEVHSLIEEDEDEEDPMDSDF